MKGGSRGIDVLLRAQTFFEFLTTSRILGESLSADAEAQRELVAARDALSREQETVNQERQELLQSTRRLAELRTEIRSTLQSEQTLLHSAQADLDRMLAERRRASVVSPAVEARRSARQVILDRKLAELLAWYAPGKGVDPFMPQRLKGTGIVTTGLSSWYGPGFDGRRASSGATYRMNQLTAASLVLPFGTLLKVTFGGKAVVVVITDRGPYVTGRVLDLSWGAAEALGLSGVKEVRMEILLPTEPAPPFP
jgi:rare lipoprotein A (peptidoglycan hydrolase)